MKTLACLSILLATAITSVSYSQEITYTITSTAGENELCELMDGYCSDKVDND